MVQQKIVVKLTMGDAKMRSKALKTAVSLPGVQSVALDGEKLVVVGEVDSVTLTTVLRKRMRHHVELVSVAENKKEESKKPEESIPVWSLPLTHYTPPYAYVPSPYYDNNPGCTIM